MEKTQGILIFILSDAYVVCTYPTHECTKISAQSIKGAFQGYSPYQKGFLSYDPSIQRILISRNIVFIETLCIFQLHIIPLPQSQFSSVLSS